MHLIAKISLLFLLLAGNTVVFSQERSRNYDRVDTVLNRVILRHEIMGGAMIHTGGIGLFFRKGYNENWFRKDLWEIAFATMKSDKQVRVNFYGTYFSNANSYVYGKLNKVFMLRGGLGQQHLLNTKPYWGGVELRLTYYGGLSVAMAKPVYLYIINQNDFPSIESKKYDPDNHFIDNIYGRAPFLDGISKTKFHPGIYAKAGLNFEFGEYSTTIKALEAGILFEGYPIPIPIMAFEDPRYFFLNFYLSFSFGKRFNKY